MVEKKRWLAKGLLTQHDSALGSLCVTPTHTSSLGSKSDLQPQVKLQQSQSQSKQGDDLTQEQPLWSQRTQGR